MPRAGFPAMILLGYIIKIFLSKSAQLKNVFKWLSLQSGHSAGQPQRRNLMALEHVS